MNKKLRLLAYFMFIAALFYLSLKYLPYAATP